MPTVGVVGQDGAFVANILKRLSSNKISCDEISIVENSIPKVNVLVVTDISDFLNQTIQTLDKSSFLLINADDKNIFPFLKTNKAKLITYGFNSKACVTVSSATSEGVQVCLQRTFYGLDEEERLPQEFFVGGSEDPSLLLAASAAFIVVLNPSLCK